MKCSRKPTLSSAQELVRILMIRRHNNTQELDTTDGEYKDYFVWAGGFTKDVPDASEPGTAVMMYEFYSFLF